MNNRRTLIATIVAGALILGAAGLGILYFVVFAGSSPQKLTLSSPAPSTSGSTSPDASPGAGTWTVGSGSQAGYRVREVVGREGKASRVRTAAVARSAGARGVTLANAKLDADLVWLCVSDSAIALAKPDFSTAAPIPNAAARVTMIFHSTARRATALVQHRVKSMAPAASISARRRTVPAERHEPATVYTSGCGLDQA